MACNDLVKTIPATGGSSDTNIDTDTPTSFTTGSVIFAGDDGTLQEDNPNLNFDDATDTLTTEYITISEWANVPFQVGDYGFESGGIDINGTTYNSALKVNDIGGTEPAQLHLHRHSTSFSATLVGTRSNSDTSSHGDVGAGQTLFTILSAGWTAGSHYDVFGQIDFAASTEGTLSGTSSPGKIIFKTTPDGSNIPVAAMTIEQDKDVTIAGTTRTEAVASSAGLTLSAISSITMEPGFGAGAIINAHLDINVDSDDIGLSITGHSTQTSDLLYVESNGGTERLAVDDSGVLTINNAYDMPTADGASADYVMKTDAAGTVTWVDISTLVAPGEWTDNSGILSPTTITDEVAIGGTTEALADIFLGTDGYSYFNKQKSATGDLVWSDDTTSVVTFDAGASAGSDPLVHINGASITSNGNPILGVSAPGWPEILSVNGGSGFGQSVLVGANQQPPGIVLSFSVVSPVSSGIFFGGWMASNSVSQQNFGFLMKAKGTTSSPTASASGDHLGSWAVAGYGTVIGVAATFKAYVDTTVGTRIDGRFVLSVGKNTSGLQTGLITGDVDERIGIGSYSNSASTKPTLDSKLHVESHEDLITIIAKADASQTENIFEARDSSDTVLTYIEPDGDIVVNADDQGLYLGAGQDFYLYFDATDSILDPTGTLLVGPTGNKNIKLNNIEIDGDLNHDGTNIGFYGTAPAAQSAAYTRNATIVEDRTLLASASATTLNNNNVLAALIADLQAIGILA